MVARINKAIDIIETSIENKKYLPRLVSDYKLDTNYKSIFKHMDAITQEKYEMELSNLVEIHKANLNQRHKFILDNKDEIISFLVLIRDNYIINIKQIKNEYFKKYYESKKEIIPPREILTEEQKIANRKACQQKYREKNRPMNDNIIEEVKIDDEPLIPSREVLTEEQKIANRKACQQKYRENNKLAKVEKINEIKIDDEPLIPSREVLTEEQKVANRKACNKQYYLKMKDKSNQL
jgi:hypothetical protein